MSPEGFECESNDGNVQLFSWDAVKDWQVVASAKRMSVHLHLDKAPLVANNIRPGKMTARMSYNLLFNEEHELQEVAALFSQYVPKNKQTPPLIADTPTRPSKGTNTLADSAAVTVPLRRRLAARGPSPQISCDEARGSLYHPCTIRLSPEGFQCESNDGNVQLISWDAVKDWQVDAFDKRGMSVHLHLDKAPSVADNIRPGKMTARLSYNLLFDGEHELQEVAELFTQYVPEKEQTPPPIPEVAALAVQGTGGASKAQVAQAVPGVQDPTKPPGAAPAECQLVTDAKERQRAWGVLAFTEGPAGNENFGIGSAFVLSTSMLGTEPLDSADNKSRIERRQQDILEEFKKAGMHIAPNATISVAHNMVSNLEVATNRYVVFVTANHVLASVLQHQSEGAPRVVLFHPTGGRIAITLSERQTHAIPGADLAFIRVPTSQLNEIPSLQAQPIMTFADYKARSKKTNSFDGIKVSNYGFPGIKVLAEGNQSAVEKILGGSWTEGPWKQSGTVVSFTRFDSPVPFPETGNKIPAVLLSYSSTGGFSGGPIIEEETGAVIGVLCETVSEERAHQPRHQGLEIDAKQHHSCSHDGYRVPATSNLESQAVTVRLAESLPRYVSADFGGPTWKTCSGA